MSTLQDCHPYYEVFSYSLFVTSGVLVLAFSFVAFFAIKNSCAVCLKQIVIFFALANLMLILVHLKALGDDFIISVLAITLYYFFINNAYCVLAGRYLLVVRGNKYVMKH